MSEASVEEELAFGIGVPPTLSNDDVRLRSLPSALEMRGVSYAYGRAPVLDRVSLRVPTGVLLGVVGPNGSGKSTLLKLAAGLCAPLEGDVLLRDGSVAVTALTARERACHVSYLPQYMPASFMSVEELALCGRHARRRSLAPLRASDVRMAHAAMERAGVMRLKNMLVRELSGGQRQRAYLAMLLAQDARVMLLDEPTSALDIGAAHEVMSLVRQATHAQSKATIAVLHDIDLALRYCDRVAVMERGKLIFQGSASRVAESPQLEDAFDVRLAAHLAFDERCYTFHPRPTHS